MSKILTLFILTSILLADTIIVDQGGNGDYTTINAAVSSASSGDTIQVNSGLYIESVTVEISLVINGAGANTTTIYNSDNAVHIGSSSNPNINISGFKIISTTTHSLMVEGGTFVIKNCILDTDGENLSAAAYVISGNGDGIATFYNCVFENSFIGAQVSGFDHTMDIINCIFNNNTYGGYVGRGNNPNGTGNFQNSIFFENNFALYREQSSDGYLLSIYNCFYSNTYDMTNADYGLGDIISDPNFVDLNSSYSLQSLSPCIDAGNPSAVYNDPDGSRNDMGVYGGPNSWGGLGPVITNIHVSPEQVEQGGTITIQATGTVE